MVKKLSVFIIFFLIPAAGCKKGAWDAYMDYEPNRAPVIVSFTSDFSGSPEPGDVARITCEASDPNEADTLTYTFSSEEGSFTDQSTAGTGSGVTFITGEISGGQEVKVSVTITDTKNASVSQTLDLGTSRLGPMLTVARAVETTIGADGCSSVTFRSDSNGFYQVVLVDDISEKGFMDTENSFFMIERNRDETVNICGPGYTGEKLLPGIPGLNNSTGTPDKIYIIVRDYMDQESSLDFTFYVEGNNPRPGGDGNIGIYDIDLTGLTLDWDAATDTESADADLLYRVYTSLSENIGSVSDAEFNGVPLTGWIKETSFDVKGLSTSVRYYYNVVVMDTDGIKSAYTPASAVTRDDDIDPVPGNSGTVNVTNITGTEVSLNWSEAADNTYSQEELEYKVVKSEERDLIDTASEADINGETLRDWAAGINSATVSGFEKGNYYLNVIVRDGNGNMAAYNPRFVRVAENAVGATDSVTLRSLGFTPDDSNSIFVTKSGSDDTGTGTEASPVASINYAITLCDATHQKVVILDSGTYTEKGFEFAGDFRGLYAALGERPLVELAENFDFWTLPEKIEETTYKAASTYSMAAVKLQNGDIFIAYEDNSNSNIGKYKVIDYTTGLESKGETVFHNNQTHNISAVMMNDGNIFIAFSDGADSRRGKYLVLDPDTGSIIKTETLFHNANTESILSIVMNDGNIFITYRDNDDARRGKYLVLNPDDWIEVKSETQFSDNQTVSISSVQLENGNIVILYADLDDSTKGKYIVLDPITWNQVKTETIIHDGQTGVISSTLLNNGKLLISYRDFDDSLKGKYIILDPDTWGIVKPETIFHNEQTFYISPLAMSDGNVFFAYSDIDDSKFGKYLVLSNSISYIKVSENSIINGITFISGYKRWFDNLISVNNSKLTLKWCDIYNNQSSTTNQTAEAIYTNGELVVQNCRFYGNDAGIYAESGKVRIIDSQFYNNRKGYALHINGPSVSYGDVLINHVDFFNNYGGIRLENNNGANEIIKNSVFHGNTGGGIVADSTVTVNNSVITDTYSGMVPGTDVLDSDPLYLNEGTPDFGYIDLFIQMVLLGYPVDSPAKGLGDDLRNAGAYDAGYVGE